MNRFLLPSGAGAYRWYYVDVTAGDWTCVVTFMLGAVFSGRYPARPEAGLPSLGKCGVSVALYHRGRRRDWVCSERRDASLLERDRRLEIGPSGMELTADRQLKVAVRERSPGGHPVELWISLSLDAAGFHPPHSLREKGPHRWQPIAPRAPAVMRLDGVDHRGLAYVDTDAGDSLPQPERDTRRWGRIHCPGRTTVIYQPGDAPGVHLVVPGTRGFPGPSPRQSSLLEWTPFHARMEAADEGCHALFEMAESEAFQTSPAQWLARWRAPVERQAA